MDVIYGLIPMMLIFGFLVVIVFIWMAKSGQFDDMDGAANRIFMEDEYPEETPNPNDAKAKPLAIDTQNATPAQNKVDQKQDESASFDKAP